MPDMLRIHVAIDGLGRSLFQLQWAIGPDQAAELAMMDAPPDFLGWERMDWERRRERADKLADAIGADIAHAIVQAFRVGSPAR